MRNFSISGHEALLSCDNIRFSKNWYQNPHNPRNWSLPRRWGITVAISFYDFMSPFASAMISPAQDTIKEDLGIPNDTLATLVLSIFVLGFAIGPFLFSPLSEKYGRVPILHISNVFFLAFNLGCGFAQNTVQILVLRFLAGFFGIGPVVVGAGVVADLYGEEERGMAISIYSLMPLFGPAVGPIMGGFITQYTTWRWIFWVSTIAGFVILVLGLLLLKETYAPKIMTVIGARHKSICSYCSASEVDEKELASPTLPLKEYMVRPVILLFTQIVIIVLAAYVAYLDGVLYIFFANFPSVWEDSYGESISFGTLNYISICLGFIIGSQVSPRTGDWVYSKLKRKNGIGKPEYRLVPVIWAALLVPAGLLLYGWPVQYEVFWLVPNIGAAIVAFSSLTSIQGIQLYVTDYYTENSASAIAALNSAKYLTGAGFPLFASAMYEKLGYGWGNTMLAFITIAIGIPAPLLLWRYGEALRKRSPYASKQDEAPGQYEAEDRGEETLEQHQAAVREQEHA